MAIKFRKPAIKFIEKADPDTLSRVQEKLNQLLISIEEQSIIPFTELDIKQMKGEWEGFYRLRVGKIRMIFTVDTASGDIEVYAIGSRGDIYKNA
ncbi:MAG TPA: plasmid stabilization system protein [Cyanobacteria bacterium UBA11369]|nr:plasmid stabilization system protein [Cyanobacteria bacterium UBA11371]HBE31601.1 plasmid stabilization system protein [Cyanobacteria bacterium UBA11368]HBE47580.1 plasmid stabilization system protein [Cyanobacteria bacterium UBA11369]